MLAYFDPRARYLHGMGQLYPQQLTAAGTIQRYVRPGIVLGHFDPRARYLTGYGKRRGLGDFTIPSFPLPAWLQKATYASALPTGASLTDRQGSVVIYTPAAGTSKSASDTAAVSSWLDASSIPGVKNKYLLFGAGGLALLSILSGGGKRRR